MKETCITCRQVINNTLHLNVQTARKPLAATSMNFQGFYRHKKRIIETRPQKPRQKKHMKDTLLPTVKKVIPYLKHKTLDHKNFVCTSGRYGAEYFFIWLTSEFTSC
jgi:hypothetical protein